VQVRIIARPATKLTADECGYPTRRGSGAGRRMTFNWCQQKKPRWGKRGLSLQKLGGCLLRG
jgi:hypothetical protein